MGDMADLMRRSRWTGTRWNFNQYHDTYHYINQDPVTEQVSERGRGNRGIWCIYASVVSVVHQFNCLHIDSINDDYFINLRSTIYDTYWDGRFR